MTKKKKRGPRPARPEHQPRGGRPRGRRSKGGRRKGESGSAGDPADLIEIKLQEIAHGGAALGFHNRRPVFIPYTIPGETVRAAIVNSQKNVDFAQGVELLDPSADRVFPQCPHFGPGRCWGCQWQHIQYEAQLLLKQDVLADQLARVGHLDDTVIDRAMRPVLPSPQQWGYNYHMTMHRSKDGELGFLRVDGRSVEPIEECHILHPDLMALYEMVEIDFSDVERVQWMIGSSGETMLVLTMTSEDAPELSADLPTSVNAILPDNEPVNLLGDAAIEYEIAGRRLRVTAGGEFRANVPQVDHLVRTVLEMLDLSEHDAVLDLYAGVGLFSAFIAPRAGLVTLVESYPPMVTDADENLADFDNVDIVEGAVEEVLGSLLEAGEKYEAAVIDPPGQGLSQQARSDLIAFGLPRIVYISSSPASMARDLRAFLAAGYELERVQPVDFAPHTYYIDAAALLVRR